MDWTGNAQNFLPHKCRLVRLSFCSSGKPAKDRAPWGWGFGAGAPFPWLAAMWPPGLVMGEVPQPVRNQQAVPGWGTRWSPSPQDFRMWLHLEIRSLKRWLSSDVIVRMGHWSSVTECPLREETRTQKQTTPWIHRTIYKPKRGAQKNPTLSPDQGEKKIKCLRFKPPRLWCFVTEAPADQGGYYSLYQWWSGCGGVGGTVAGGVQHPWLFRDVMVRQLALDIGMIWL